MTSRSKGIRSNIFTNHAFSIAGLTFPRSTLQLFYLVVFSLLTACQITGSSSIADSSSVNLLQRFCNGNSKVFKLNKAQRRSLSSVCNAWYPGSDLPLITADTTEGACDVLVTAGSREREFLKTALGINLSAEDPQVLCYLATLDIDDDGILDYQISDIGKFLENDIDVDNDLTYNVRDTRPLLENASDAPLTAKDLPEHLRFACATEHGGPQGRACELLEALYDNYDMVTINRDFFPEPGEIEKNLESVYDAVHHVLRLGLETHPGAIPGKAGLWTMQTVAFEQCSVMRKSPWNKKDKQCFVDPKDTEASAQAHNGLFTIFPSGSRRPAYRRLGTYVHEFGHLWQFALDVQSEADTQLLTTENLWVVPNFEKELSRWGWEFAKFKAQKVEKEIKTYNHVLPAAFEVLEIDEDTSTYRGDYLAYWRDAIVYQGLVTSDILKKVGVFGYYSMTSAWEWHADVFNAYLLRIMEDNLVEWGGNGEDSAVAGETIAWFRAHMLQEFLNSFYPPNLDDELYQDLRENILPIDQESLDSLVCRYVVFDDSIYTKLQHFSTLPDWVKQPPDHVKQCVRKDWKNYCQAYVPEEKWNQEFDCEYVEAPSGA